MQVRSKLEPIRYTFTCSACNETFGKARLRGSVNVCPRCLNLRRLERWAIANPGRKRELNSKWSAANREKDRASKSAWQKRNPGKEAAKTRRRQCDQSSRTPPWADQGAIEAFYVMAQRARECTGIRFEVDHVIPLRGRGVSGLHVPHNLRVISRQENMMKGNR